MFPDYDPNSNSHNFGKRLFGIFMVTDIKVKKNTWTEKTYEGKLLKYIFSENVGIHSSS